MIRDEFTFSSLIHLFKLLTGNYCTYLKMYFTILCIKWLFWPQNIYLDVSFAEPQHFSACWENFVIISHDSFSVIWLHFLLVILYTINRKYYVQDIISKQRKKLLFLTNCLNNIDTSWNLKEINLTVRIIYNNICFYYYDIHEE